MVTGIEVYYKLLKELVNWNESKIEDYIYGESFKDDLREDSVDILLHKSFEFEIEDEDTDYYYLRFVFEPRERY